LDAFDIGRWISFTSLRSIYLCGTSFNLRHWRERRGQLYVAFGRIKERLVADFAPAGRTGDVCISMKGWSPYATDAGAEWDQTRQHLAYKQKFEPFCFDPYLSSDKYTGYSNTGLEARQRSRKKQTIAWRDEYISNELRS
jgi:hypothetical protein